MTLREAFEAISESPAVAIGFLTMIPVLTWILSKIAGKESALSPWKYFYSILIYIASILGVLSIVLWGYLFLFERQSVWDVNLILQILPVVSMVLTLLIIRQVVPYSAIPGFDRLSGLIIMLFALLIFLWVIDRTRILVISFLPIQYALIGFLGALLIVRWAWGKFVKY
jgi:hypothetical protein